MDEQHHDDAEAGSLERAYDQLLEQLKKSGLKLLDRPGTPGRNGSVSLALRESLARLLPGELAVGNLGVVGPTRMDYPGTMAAVRAVARYVSRILDEA